MSENNPVELVPGLHQIRLPIPIKTLKSVFVYLVRDGDQNLLIDTGWNSEETYDALTTAFNEIGFSIGEIQNIVISHLHPDHFGLAARIKRESAKGRVLMHRFDAENLQERIQSHKRFLGNLDNWLLMHGTPVQVLGEMTGSSLEKMEDPSQPDVKLRGGELLKVGDKFRFEVIHTPGHTIGQICLYDQGGSTVLFSGDHVLPTITPNVSLSPLYVGDPLGDYVKSLEILRPLKVSKILPSHEYVFENLEKRLKEIEQHHTNRLQNTLDVVNSAGGPVSGYEVASMLRWYADWEKLNPWEKRAAVMETLAHLEHLKRNGKVAEVRDEEGEETRIHYLPLEHC